MLVQRHTTERLEVVEAGSARLIGTDNGENVEESGQVLDEATTIDTTVGSPNPHGGGQASKTIGGKTRNFAFKAETMDSDSDQLLTRQAADLYKKGDYKLARAIYKELQQRLSPDLFKLNVDLCDKRLRTKDSPSKLHEPKPNKNRNKIRIACILDEFSFSSFSPECQTVQLECGNHITQLEDLQPDVLFVESAWLGQNDTWKDQIAHHSDNLKAVINWCRAHGVPTAFWNKEDPVHYETFLSTAMEFDTVFTTDIDCIPQYKYMLKHDNVFFLPFSCQPMQLGPTEKYKRKESFSFAGAYYTRYPERIKDLEGFIEHLPQLLPLDIFDRNYGKNDPRYKFPEKYQRFIRGGLRYTEIDQAYNGYTYSINLNSVKQSQSMFARRIFDLLATNTLVVSNYSRGLRLMLGDLCISTDDPQSMLNRLRKNSEINDRIRLQGLRKVLTEFSSSSSFQYLIEKTLGKQRTDLAERVIVFSCIQDSTKLGHALDNYTSQTYINKVLYLIYDAKEDILTKHQLSLDRNDVHVISRSCLGVQLPHLIKDSQWVSIMDPSDYWGANYLKDLMLAKQYTKSLAISKSRIFHIVDGITQNISAQYCEDQPIIAASSIFQSSRYSILDILDYIHNPNAKIGRGYLVDPFNYCAKARGLVHIEPIRRHVDDIEIDAGLSLHEVRSSIDCLPPSGRSISTDSPSWDRSELYSMFVNSSNKSITLSLDSNGILVANSKKLDGQHDYLYSHLQIPINDFPSENEINGYFDCDPGLDLMIGFRFISRDGRVISTGLMHAGRNCTVTIPEETTHIKPCLRIQGSGRAAINQFSFAHYNWIPPLIISKSRILLITSRYPSYDNLYQHAFVHSRLLRYKELGVTIEVFQLLEGHPLRYREFENIDVISGGRDVLELILRSNQHDKILIHFLTYDIWDIVKRFTRLEKFIWAHGSEIQLWHRREFLYETNLQKQEARLNDQKKIDLWQNVFNHCDRIHMIFISKYLASQAFADYSINEQSISWSVINNPIDTELFRYTKKSVDQRKRILSIRPYSSIVYTNDLVVQAILHLSREDFFQDLNFLLIGDGNLFEDILAPLRDFVNVEIRRTFLRQNEIAAIHQDYGIFLAPTRMDTQGVSRDEAMSSGLVPITTNVAAVSEFVDETCGILSAPNDAVSLANGIKHLYLFPDKFSSLSENAASAVRSRSSARIIAERELNMINPKN